MKTIRNVSSILFDGHNHQMAEKCTYMIININRHAYIHIYALTL